MRVVFDCNTLLQALASPSGPAAACFELAVQGRVLLFVSSRVIEELRDVTSRLSVTRKMRFDADRVAQFIDTLLVIATLLDDVPVVFSYPRDPDDAHYVNLALAADARLIVSRDRDLLDLPLGRTPEAKQLMQDHPDFAVMTPVGFLETQRDCSED